MTKPFSPTEVVLRVGAVLARTGAPDAEPRDRRRSATAGCVLDSTGTRRGSTSAPLDLTPTEWGILTTLATVPGRPFSRYELVNRVRGYEFAGYERSIDSHVKNLRHKLGRRRRRPRRDRHRRRLPAGPRP